CGDGSDCGSGSSYSAAELSEVGLTEGVSLGCGNPTLLAKLEPGQVVLDLGSGAGLDVLLSARRVAPGGHAYGVDMTDEMLAGAGDQEGPRQLGRLRQRDDPGRGLPGDPGPSRVHGARDRGPLDRGDAGRRGEDRQRLHPGSQRGRTGQLAAAVRSGGFA